MIHLSYFCSVNAYASHRSAGKETSTLGSIADLFTLSPTLALHLDYDDKIHIGSVN
jgi:hypothetical protein